MAIDLYKHKTSQRFANDCELMELITALEEAKAIIKNHADYGYDVGKHKKWMAKYFGGQDDQS